MRYVNALISSFANFINPVKKSLRHLVLRCCRVIATDIFARGLMRTQALHKTDAIPHVSGEHPERSHYPPDGIEAERGNCHKQQVEVQRLP